MRNPLVFAIRVRVVADGLQDDVVVRSATIGGLVGRKVRDAEQRLTQLTRYGVVLGRKRAFAFAEGAAVVLHAFRVGRVAFPPQLSDLFRQIVDGGPDVVAFRDDRAQPFVERGGASHLTFERRITAPRDRGDDRVGLGSDAPDVEHPPNRTSVVTPARCSIRVDRLAVIEVDKLVVDYGDVRAVDGVSFAIDAGQVLALLGPNGAGKTSTIESLEGYRRPSGGRARVLDLDPIADHGRLVRRIGVMLQAGGVYPGIRVLEALRLFAAYYDDAENPEAMLERVGLAHRRSAPWRRLSGGEQQRLSLALALIGKPDVAFLDEPTSGIDVGGRQVIRELIGELRQSGVTVLVTTHDLEEAERLADRIVIIDRGRVVASGTPAELMRSNDDEEILFGAPPSLDTASLGRALNAFVDEVTPGEYKVAMPPTPGNVAALTAWLAEHDLPLADLRAGRQRLEDVFLRLTAITGEHPVIPPEAAK